MKKFINWLVNDLGQTKLFENIKNDYFFPIRFYIKWNFGSLKNKNINEYRNRKLTFEDDFNSNELDRSKWNTTFPWGRMSTNGNQWATDGENLKFYNSNVQFQTKYEPNTYEGWWGKHTCDFTTAHIDTKDKFSQQFGRFDIKVNLTDKIGLWPAFWLLTNNYRHPDAPQWDKDGNLDWNKCGDVITPEIDIFEQFGDKKKRKKLQFTLHSGLSYAKPWKKANASSIYHVDLTKKFIMVSVEITKDFLKWYVNDCLVKVIYQKHLPIDHRVFRPLYIILCEGSNSNVNYLLDEYKKDKNYLPDGMIVDWVRVYKPLYYENPKDIETEL